MPRRSKFSKLIDSNMTWPVVGGTALLIGALFVFSTFSGAGMFGKAQLVGGISSSCGNSVGCSATVAQTPNLVLVDGNGKFTTGHWTNDAQTQGVLDGNAGTVTVAGDEITFNGASSALRQTVHMSSSVGGQDNRDVEFAQNIQPSTWTVYHNAAGKPTHMLSTNNSNVAIFIDAVGRISTGIMNPPSKDFAVNIYPGDPATVTGNKVTWKDGSVWTKDASHPITVAPYLNQTRVPVYIIGDYAGHMIFVDSLSHWSLAHFLNGTDVSVDSFPGDTATLVPNGVNWKDGTAWTAVLQTAQAQSQLQGVQLLNLIDQQRIWNHVVRFSNAYSGTAILVNGQGSMTVVPTTSLQFSSTGVRVVSSGTNLNLVTGSQADASVYVKRYTQNGNSVFLVSESKFLPLPLPTPTPTPSPTPRPTPTPTLLPGQLSYSIFNLCIDPDPNVLIFTTKVSKTGEGIQFRKVGDSDWHGAGHPDIGGDGSAAYFVNFRSSISPNLNIQWNTAYEVQAFVQTPPYTSATTTYSPIYTFNTGDAPTMLNPAGVKPCDFRKFVFQDSLDTQSTTSHQITPTATPTVSPTLAQCPLTSANQQFLSRVGGDCVPDNGFNQPAGSNVDPSDPAIAQAITKSLADEQQNCVAQWPHARHDDYCKLTNSACVAADPASLSGATTPATISFTQSNIPAASFQNLITTPTLQTADGTRVTNWPGGPFNGNVCVTVSGFCTNVQACKAVGS